MARLALSIGGMVLGNLLPPSIGSALGGALGAYVGGLVDQQLLGPERETGAVPGRACRTCASSRPAMAG